VTPEVREKLKTIVKKKVLGETATYSSVIEEALKKSLTQNSEGRWTLAAFESTTVMLDKKAKQVLLLPREEGKDLTSNAHCGEYHFEVSLSRFSNSTSLFC